MKKKTKKQKNYNFYKLIKDNGKEVVFCFVHDKKDTEEHKKNFIYMVFKKINEL